MHLHNTCTRCRSAPGPGAWWQVQASLNDFAPICKPHIPSSRQHLVAVVVVVLMVVAVMVIGQVIDDGNKGETFIFSLQNKSSAFRKSATNCTVHNLICVCLTFCIGNCKKKLLYSSIPEHGAHFCRVAASDTGAGEMPSVNYKSAAYWYQGTT